MGLVARFDFMPRVALNVFQQVPSIIWSILDIRQADNELIVTVALIERRPVNTCRATVQVNFLRPLPMKDRGL
jgi:hypothetical protein